MASSTVLRSPGSSSIAVVITSATTTANIHKYTRAPPTANAPIIQTNDSRTKTFSQIREIAEGEQSSLKKLPRLKPDLGYARRPENAGNVTLFFWRWRMWFEGTFALTVMETWERWLVCKVLSSVDASRTRSTLNPVIPAVTIFGILLGLLATFLVKFLPYSLLRMQERAIYYLWGQATGFEGEKKLLCWFKGLALTRAINQAGTMLDMN